MTNLVQKYVLIKSTPKSHFTPFRLIHLRYISILQINNKKELTFRSGLIDRNFEQTCKFYISMG